MTNRWGRRVEERREWARLSAERRGKKWRGGLLAAGPSEAGPTLAGPWGRGEQAAWAK